MSLRLLFVNASLTDGGSERAMSLVAQALVARGHDVTMALVREKGRTYPLDRRIAVKQFHYGSRGPLRKFIHRVRQLRHLMRADDYDFVVCYMWDLNVTTLFASLGLGQRVIVSERALPGARSRGRLAPLLERIFYRFAHRIVYQTENARSYCPPSLQGQSTVVPNMIEMPRRETTEQGKERRIISAGRLSAQKNFPLLLHSFAGFLQTHPGWTLEICGRGPLEDELKALAHHLGVSDSVVFAGYVEDMAARMTGAGMFVLSSDYEGISNAMAEAMALGLPAICTDCPVGGAALLIEDRVSGMLVPVRDQDALTTAMREVASDDVLAVRLSVGAQDSVARFAPARLADVWEESVLC